MDWFKTKVGGVIGVGRHAGDGAGVHQQVPTTELPVHDAATALDDSDVKKKAKEAAEAMRQGFSQSKAAAMAKISAFGVSEKFSSMKAMVSAKLPVPKTVEKAPEEVEGNESSLELEGGPSAEPEAEAETSWSGEMRDSLTNEVNEFCTLSYKQRLIGFACCAALGFILSLGSFMRLAKALAGNPVPFAISYSFGNLISLCSTGFIVGPKKQFQNMFQGHRAPTVIVYLGSIVCTLIVALWRHFPLAKIRGLILILLIMLQMVAYLYYVCSFIPYGRQMATSFGKRVVSQIV